MHNKLKYGVKYLYYMTPDDLRKAYRLAHSHNHIEILFIVKGSGWVIVEGKMYETKKGDLIFYDKNTLHEDAPGLFTTFTFSIGIDDSYLTELLKGYNRSFFPVVSFLDMYDLLLSLFQHAMLYYHDETTTSSLILRKIVEFIISLTETRAVPIHANIYENEETDTYLQIIKYLRAHFPEDISIDTISQSCNLSPYHISHIFKEKTGFSPMHYVTRLRLGRAQTLLVHSNKTVTEIAHEVGFNSSSAFNYSFRTQFGTTPLKFRSLYQNLPMTQTPFN